MMLHHQRRGHPVFTKGCLHIFNQQIKNLYISTDRTYDDRLGLGFQHCIAYTISPLFTGRWLTMTGVSENHVNAIKAAFRIRRFDERG